MNLITRTMFTLAIVAVPAAFAQKWELGGGAGGGFYTSTDVTNPLGNAAGKFQSNIAASAWLGNNSGRLLGGELRYDYQRGDAKLSSGGTTATFGAQSQAIHYDFLLHFAPRSSPVRPFVAAGGGVKIYQGTGTEVAFQPLSQIALLTKTSDTQPLVSVGAGVKFALGKVIGLRAEIHDFLTPFPNKVIAPAANSKSSGWLQDIVVSFGISILF
jgi:hypothetical protein